MKFEKINKLFESKNDDDLRLAVELAKAKNWSYWRWNTIIMRNRYRYGYFAHSSEEKDRFKVVCPKGRELVFVIVQGRINKLTGWSSIFYGSRAIIIHTKK